MCDRNRGDARRQDIAARVTNQAAAKNHASIGQTHDGELANQRQELPAPAQGRAPIPAPAPNPVVIGPEDAIEQMWVEGRRQFAERMRTQHKDNPFGLGTSYESFLSKMTVEKREAYWSTIFESIPPILHALRDDPRLIPGLEEKLARQLRENELKPDPRIDGVRVSVQ